MDFFKKLNTLVQAQINDIIHPIREDEPEGKTRRNLLARQDVRSGLEGDVTTLRKRVNEAVDYEGSLQAKVDKLYQKISELDALADEALRAGREEDARAALGRMHQAQREVTLLEADLSEHRVLTQQLISQVNTLEAVVEQSKQEQAQQAVQPPAAKSTPSPSSSIKVEIEADDEDESEADSGGQNVVQGLAEKLDNTRKKLSELIASASTTDKPLMNNSEVVEEVPQPPKAVHPMDKKAVDDDLARRISRLSKPEPGDKKK